MAEEALVEEAPATVAPASVAPPAEQADWKAGLPEDLRDNPNFSKYSSLESLAKGHINAVGMLGKTPELAVPDNDDERNEFYNKLGRPIAPDGYEFKDFETPENLKEYVDSRTDSYRQTAHGLGLSAEQAAGLHEWYMQGNIEGAQATIDTAAKMQADATTALKNEWGEAYNKNVTMAQRALAEFGDDQLVEYLEATGLGDNPAMVKAFAKIAEGMMGDAFIEDGLTGDSPASIDADIKEIMARKEYWDADSPERPALVKKVADLMKRLHPEEG